MVSSCRILSILIKHDSILQNIGYVIWSLNPQKCLTLKYIGSRSVEYRLSDCHIGRSACSDACKGLIMIHFVTYSTHTWCKYLYIQISIYVHQFISDKYANGKNSWGTCQGVSHSSTNQHMRCCENRYEPIIMLHFGSHSSACAAVRQGFCAKWESCCAKLRCSAKSVTCVYGLTQCYRTVLSLS